MDQTNDAGDVNGTTVQQDAVTSDSQPDYKSLYDQALREASEYKNRFNGLQGTYQREQAKWKTDLAGIEQLRSTVDALTAEKATLSTTLEQIQDKLGQIETEKELSEAGLERMKIVVGEFPELTQFLAKGLIPDETGDELRAKLKELSTTIKAIKDGSVETFRAGESPQETPRPKLATTAKDLQAQLMDAFRAGDQQLYDKIYNEIISHGGHNG